jgi:hypothetical protein
MSSQVVVDHSQIKFEAYHARSLNMKSDHEIFLMIDHTSSTTDTNNPRAGAYFEVQCTIDWLT